MSESGEKLQREVKDHLLFEVATEVAHRGRFSDNPDNINRSRTDLADVQKLVVSTPSSNQKRL